MKRLPLLLLLALTIACTATPTLTPAPTAIAPARTATALPASSTPSATAIPTVAVLPTATGTATPAPLPTTADATATALPANCLKLQYVADVTIPDGTRINPGAAFIKTWRIRNSGQCAWENVNLVFAAGNALAGETTAIPTTAAGDTIEVSVNLVAPNTPGRYQGEWSLQSSADTFGKLTVVIVSGDPVVVQPTAVATRVVAQPTPAATIAPPAQPQPTAAPAACCKYCNPAKSKPCGDSCISLDKTCQKGPGCACSK